VAWLPLLPLLTLGSMMFWSVALGLGGWSFMLVNEQTADMNMDAVGPMPPATAIEPQPGNEMAGPTGGSPTGGAPTGGSIGGATAGSMVIPVQVEESQESEDVNDNAGAVHAPEGD
jgi:hypothetical protein